MIRFIKVQIGFPVPGKNQADKNKKKLRNSYFQKESNAVSGKR